MRPGVAMTLAIAAISIGGCRFIEGADEDRAQTAREFPRPDRPVAPIVSNRFSNEDSRERVGEADKVMDAAGIVTGMTVADVGAGEGYYTVRLAQRVGAAGRVLAQDIDRDAVRGLADRVARERLDNVSIKLGTPDDPQLPANSFDRIFLVHMYHEVSEPYAFLWRLYPALRKGGEVIVVDADRAIRNHGTPPKLLFCEFEAVGFKLKDFIAQPEIDGYFARFIASGNRPDPDAIRACKGG